MTVSMGIGSGKVAEGSTSDFEIVLGNDRSAVFRLQWFRADAVFVSDGLAIFDIAIFEMPVH